MRETHPDADRRAAVPRLRLLGDLELTCGGEPLKVSQAAQRVLVLLAVAHRGRAAERTGLAARLWPDTTPERAVANLRSSLWRMPRPRGRPLVTCTHRTVDLSGELEVDLWQADALMDESTAAVRPVDVTLLHDDLLPRWDEEWLAVEREGFRQRRLHVLEATSAVLRERGRYTEALIAALSAVRSEPLRETAHLHVIRVHLDEGNQSEAVRQYQHYRGLLSRELGLAPSPALTGLMHPLLRSPGRPRRAAG